MPNRKYNSVRDVVKDNQLSMTRRPVVRNKIELHRNGRRTSKLDIPKTTKPVWGKLNGAKEAQKRFNKWKKGKNA